MTKKKNDLMGVPLGGNRSFVFFIGVCAVAARYNLAAFLPVDCGNFLF
jgi:hypothetical protein